MLKKAPDIKVTAEEPFAEDALGRNASVERLTNLVTSTEQPFVLSIEAPWGWGKTTFIRMWKAHLESKGHMCLLFNAWQNDFVDDPLLAFLGQITRLIEHEKKELNASAPIKKYLGEIKRIGAGVLRKTLPLAIQVATHGILNQETIKRATTGLSEESDKLADFASALAKERLEKYEAESNGVEKFRLNLEKLTEELINKHGASPMIFFVDELDRCRPDFAITLLERIKHLFNVNRVVFVLSIDRSQLNESVRALYGLRANPDGYLRRFIDITYSLQPPSSQQFTEHLYRRFGMDEVFKELPQGLRYGEIWKTAFVHCTKALSLSLRVQEQCFTEMNIAWRLAKREVFPAALSFYAALRAHRSGIFRDLQDKRVSIETVFDWFSGVDDPWYEIWFDAALIHAFCNGRDERKDRLAKLEEKYVKLEQQTYDRRNVGELAKAICDEGYRRGFLDTLALLHMSEEFR